ncbi:hypothetical protein BGZ73_006199 [Actinomortierella ambigua]|nr:hypothetical protein BGZ73_006199 [Actinomortierella ambigua]
MTPFDQYEKVDVYLVDVVNKWQLMLQANADLNLGMLASRKDATMFPDNLPINRTCRVVFISQDQPLDGTHRTVNSSDFTLIRTQQVVNGTLTPLPPISSTPSATPSPTKPSRTSSPTITHMPGSGSEPSMPEPPLSPPDSASNHSSLSSLAIGLIVAGSVAIIIAAVAIAQVFRTRRRYMREHAHFKTLPEPSSPRAGSIGKGGGTSSFIVEGSAAGAVAGTSSGLSGSEPKPDLEGGARVASFVAPSLATGRNSSTTVRSHTAMLQGVQALSGYSTPEPIPTIVVPLVERRPSTLDQSGPTSVSSPDYPSQEQQQQQQQQHSLRFTGVSNSSTTSLGRLSLEPVISAGDARLIADTFRKSLRRPRWEEAGVDEDDDDDQEQDEARRAANELLRKELSEQGLDVQKTGVQRRVTIQTRPTGPEPDAAL